MKKRFKKAMCLLLCMCVLLPSGSAMTFATDGGDVPSSVNVMKQTEPKEEQPTESQEETKKTTDNQQKEEKQKTDNTKEKAVKKDSKKAVDTGDSFEITFSVEGEGILTVKEKGAAEETKQAVTEADDLTLSTEEDAVYEITAYKDDTMSVSLDGEGVEISKQSTSDPEAKNQETSLVTVKKSDASVKASFKGSTQHTQAASALSVFSMASARAASSMTIHVSMTKNVYGYNSSGSSYYPNKYGLFTTGSSKVYNKAVYCAEHDRPATTGKLTGTVINNAKIRKILYYGYRGPKQWSGFSNSAYNGKYKIWSGGNTNRTEACGITVTAQALSNAYNSLGGKGTKANPSGLSAFMNYVNKQKDPGSSYTVYRATASTQDMMWGVYSPNGKVTLKKVSASNNDIVKECPNMYSVAGAKYQLKKPNGTLMGTLTTKKDGSSNTLTVPAGTYKLKETVAPKGYMLDTKTYTVKVTSGNTETVTVSDRPIFDPDVIVLEKTPQDGEGSFVNMEADMSGAEFTIKYYDSLANDVSKLTPKRTWKLQTKKHPSGKYTAHLMDEYRLPDSDPFFISDAGNPIIPRGTITVQETKAPEGYKVDPKVYQYKVDGTGNVIQLNFGNTPEQPNTPLNPQIGTTASDITTEDNVGAEGEEITIVDKVSFKELMPSETYTIKGKLMDQETGEPFLTADGKEVTAEKTFRVVSEDDHGLYPGEEVVRAKVNGNGASGTVELTYTINKTDLSGKSVVVFEDLYYDEQKIASHTELEDENQTIHFPEIKTTAMDGITGTDLGMPDKEAVIEDKVDCKNLIIGKEYTIKGVLMNKGTGEPLLVDGEEVRAEETFTATEENMTVSLFFRFDSSALQGETTVVFEDLYHNGILVESHNDLEDEDQTIDYPDMGTTAWISSAGKRIKPVTIVDRVEYTNLQPGFTYTVKGILMDQKTGEPFLTKEGKEVTSETTFTPEEKDGFVELTYTLKGEDIAGKTVVVFEDIYHEDKLIMTHSDIEDKGQTVGVGRLTVWYDENSEGFGSAPKTGDSNQLYVFAALLAISVAALSVITAKKLKERKEGNGEETDQDIE